VLPVRKEHFSRWLALFLETVNAHFAGPKAEEAKGRAASIADTFAQRMGLLKDASGLGPGIAVRAIGSHLETR
jgi:hemoglobin